MCVPFRNKPRPAPLQPLTTTPNNNDKHKHACHYFNPFYALFLKALVHVKLFKECMQPSNDGSQFCAYTSMLRNANRGLIVPTQDASIRQLTKACIYRAVIPVTKLKTVFAL